MNVAVCSEPAGLNLLSICTGGGGLDLGVELAIPGARAVCMVEREAFAVAHLVEAMQQGLLAPAPVWSDARTFNGRPWRGLVDGLIGGIPCQPHSKAGKQLGEDDERDLWSTARRLIVQSGVWWVLIENVEGMLSTGGAERVCWDLRRLGFDVEIGMFSAEEVGAPHLRQRVFILGLANTARRNGDLHARSRRAGERAADAGGPSEGMADTSSIGRHEGRAGSFGNGGRPEPSCGRLPVEHAVSARRAATWPGPSVNSARQSLQAGRELGDAERGRRPGLDGRQPGPQLEDRRCAVADALRGDLGGRTDEPERGAEGRAAADGPGSGVSLFPPGPGDLRRWLDVLARRPDLAPVAGRDGAVADAGGERDGHRHDGEEHVGRISPAGATRGRVTVSGSGFRRAKSGFRRVADGLADRMDRLRLCGNGVVPLEAAYALRTLATRAAARGCAGAARLVRMMCEAA